MTGERVNAVTLGLPNDKKIIAEYKRLCKIFSDLPEKQFEIAKKLISRMAFLSVTLDRLEADIVDNGFSESYQNGANQHGVKKSTAADLHISYSKNLFAVTKQLNDLLSKANPSLGALLSLSDLVDEWERVKMIPAEKSNFINKQLNVFTSVDELSFLDVRVIQKNNKVLEGDSLVGGRCYGGFDLSETEDFTAACLEFPLAGGDYFVLEHTWLPERKMKEDHEKLDWRTLIQNGWITVIPGDYVDYNLVFQWFMEQRAKYRIDSIGYDPAKAFMLIQLMVENGFVLNEVRQGELTLTAPLDHLKERFLDGAIVHNNNPMFNWYLGNVRLTKRSVNATYMPTKQNRYRKIDGFMALLDAHTEMLRKNPLIISPDKNLTTVIKL